MKTTFENTCSTESLNLIMENIAEEKPKGQ